MNGWNGMDEEWNGGMEEWDGMEWNGIKKTRSAGPLHLGTETNLYVFDDDDTSYMIYGCTSHTPCID